MVADIKHYTKRGSQRTKSAFVWPNSSWLNIIFSTVRIWLQSIGWIVHHAWQTPLSTLSNVHLIASGCVAFIGRAICFQAHRNVLEISILRDKVLCNDLGLNAPRKTCTPWMHQAKVHSKGKAARKALRNMHVFGWFVKHSRRQNNQANAFFTRRKSVDNQKLRRTREKNCFTRSREQAN